MSATISHFKVQAFEFNNSTKGDFGNGKLCLFAIDIVLVSGYPFTHYMLSKTDASCSPSAILFRMSTISQNLNNRLNVTSIFSCNLQQPCCSYEQQNYLPSFHYNVMCLVSASVQTLTDTDLLSLYYLDPFHSYVLMFISVLSLLCSCSMQ